MILILSLRLFYLLCVVVGLIVCIRELLDARRLLRTLIDDDINGLRQTVAEHQISEEGQRVTIQVLLLGPALIGLFMPLHLARLLIPYLGPIVLAQLCHMAVAFYLARKAITNRRHRKRLLHILDAVERAQEKASVKKLTVIEELAVKTKDLAADSKELAIDTNAAVHRVEDAVKPQ